MACAYQISNLTMLFSDLEMVEEFTAMQMVFRMHCTSINTIPCFMNAYIVKGMLSLNEGNNFDAADSHTFEKRKSIVPRVFYTFLPTIDFLSCSSSSSWISVPLLCAFITELSPFLASR